MLLLDVDVFRRFNAGAEDHAGGDSALGAVARVLLAHVRSFDAASRFGVADELLLVLPGTDLESASATAERIRARVEALQFGDRRITVSVGAAEWRRGEDVNGIVRRADHALGVAKRQARIVYAVPTKRRSTEGDAVNFMRSKASKAPAPTTPADTRIFSMAEGRLIDSMLKNGERGSVAEYLERFAASRAPR